MTRHRRERRATWAIGVAMALVACGSDEAPQTAPQENGAAGAGGYGFAGASGLGGNAFGGSAAGAPAADLGGLPVVDLPDAPCVPAGGAETTVVAAGDLTPHFGRVGALGTRRFALDPSDGALVVFDPAGAAAASTVATDAIAAAASTTTLFAVEVPKAGSFVLGAFSGGGSPATSPIADHHVDCVGIAASETATLVAWRDGGTIQGAVTTPAGTASFSFAIGSGGAAACTLVPVWTGSDFAVVWTRSEADGTTKTSWARVKPDATLAFAVPVLTSGARYVLYDVAKTKSGYALLLGEGPWHPVVAFLGEGADVRPPAYRLGGADLGYAIAAQGDVVAVAASAVDGRSIVRVVDPTASAAPPPVCVDDAAAGATSYGAAAVMADGAGWGVLARKQDGSSTYRRTDLAGTGGSN